MYAVCRWNYVICVCLLIGLSATHTDAAESPRPDPARVEQLAGMLPPSPQGVGPMIADRAAWEAVARSPRFDSDVRAAEEILDRPYPELTDELYLDFSRTGNRTRCQGVLSERHGRLPRLVLAECIENKGRFLPAIERAVEEICGEKTWVLPAHDRGLANFRGTVREIDLAVAAVSWNLATADYWLGERLSPATRRLIRDQLERRTFMPFAGAVARDKPQLWWITCTNNWNAVCLAGVTGSALAIIESPQRRAFFAAAAERAVQNFVDGFTDDGYCSEGIGYWNYGFGHYVMLAETLQQATGGKLDLLAPPKIRRIALFGRRMEICPGVYPAFADCSVTARPDSHSMAFLSRRYELGLADVERESLLLAAGPSSSLFSMGVYCFTNSASRVPAATAATAPPVRDWFADAGIYIGRPMPDDPGGLGVALKGGHNDEHHNHNDVGSFLVTVGGRVPLIDPGGEVYTARTFSSRRYDSGVLNSFGHPVPRVAGKLQRTGRSAAAKVLRQESTEQADTLVFDLASAYGVDALESLQRSFVYRRQGPGSLTVADEVKFDSPQPFGTALITFSKWTQPRPDRLLVGEGPAAVQVDIVVEGGEFRVTAEKIEEDISGGRIPTRLGIDLAAPTARAKITLVITPAHP